MTTFREATEGDVPAIIRLLADDDFGRVRELVSDPLDERYRAAFAAIDSDPNQMLVVAVDPDDRVIGCMQLTFIPGLSRIGLWRGQIESLRIARSARGSGIGSELIEWAIAACRGRGCKLIQLTSDKRRADAHRFYVRHGFIASHEGLKLEL